MAMLAVVMCVLVVVSLTAVAVKQTVGNLSQTVDGRNILQTADAASAGIQAELAALKSVETASSGTSIPCANGTVTVATAGDPAGVQSYTLAMSQPVSTQSGASQAALHDCSTTSFAVPSAMDPWYVLVQAVGSNASTSRTHQAGRTVDALIQVSDSHSAGSTTTTSTSTTIAQSTSTSTVATTTTTTVPQTTTTTTPTGFYNAAAAAQIANVNLLNSWTAFQYPSPADSVTNDGFKSGAAVTLAGPVSLPVADAAINMSAGSLTVEASQTGSSYSCAGVLSSGGSLTGGSATSACTPAGSSNALSVNLLGLPGTASVLTSLVSTLTLNVDAATCWAGDTAGGTAQTGNASLLNATVTFKALGLGALTKSVSLNLASSVPPQTNVLSAITAAISNSGGLNGLLATNISNALTPVLSLTSNYQTLNSGLFSVSALHIALLGTAATADLAMCKVGPNTSYTPTSTTTTSTTTAPATTTTTVPGSTTTVASSTTSSSTSLALPADGVTVVWIKQVA